MTQLDILKQYNDGDMKPSKAYVQLRAIKSELEDIIKQVEDGLVDEITRMGNEDLIVDGFKISHMKGRQSLDYKVSDVWKEYKESLKLVEEKLKQATKLQSDIVDVKTGEVYEPLPTKYGAGYFKMERARMEVA
jgi:hypothetical protein